MTGIASLYPIGDLLRIVEAAGQHEVHAHRRAGHALDAAQASRGTNDLRPRRGRLGLRPVVEVTLPPGRQAPHVRSLAVRAVELLGRVALLVPLLVVLLLRDAEVDERAVPDVGKAHGKQS